MPNFNTIGTNTVYVNESPMVFLVGATPIFTFNFLGTGTLSNASTELYRNKDDVSGAQLTGSQPTPSGRSVSTKQLSLTLPGDYELYVTVTDGGMVRVKALRIMVKKKGVY